MLIRLVGEYKTALSPHRPFSLFTLLRAALESISAVLSLSLFIRRLLLYWRKTLEPCLELMDPAAAAVAVAVVMVEIPEVLIFLYGFLLY